MKRMITSMLLALALLTVGVGGIVHMVEIAHAESDAGDS